MKRHSKTLLLTSLVTLLPIPVQILGGREWGVALWIPLLMLAVQWLCVYWTLKDPRSEKQSKKPMTIIFWIIPILTNFVCAVDWAITRRANVPLETVFCLLFGLMFLVLGNYLPKCRQNTTMGIKLPWTYASEENWNVTHRFAGKLWVAGGLVTLLSAFLPGEWMVAVLLGNVILMCCVPMAYSYAYYRKQKARGDALTIPPIFTKKQGKQSMGILAVVLAFIAVMMFMGDLEFTLGEEALTVKASFHDDLTVSYDAIEAVQFRERAVEGRRAWGYGSARLLLGTFENAEFGYYTRYTYTGKDYALVLTLSDQTVVLAGETRDQTRALYESLLEKLG